jgi:tetratricopeptide (TPR) repeat protein
MFNTPAKQARENIARATRDLLKGDLSRALEFSAQAAKLMAQGSIFGREKFEVEVHMQEFLKEFNNHPEVKAHFTAKGVHVTPYVRYDRGGESKLLTALGTLFVEIKKKAAASQENKAAAKDEEIKSTMEQAQKWLDAKEFPKAKSKMRLLVEKYPAEPGLKTDVGGRLLKAGLYFEAGEFLEEAIAQNPKDSKALAFAVQAYKNAREFPKVEELYKFALKQYGSHPKTLLHMAEMYLEWHKWDEAFNYAKQAFEGDKSLDKAKAIMDETGKRIFG